jgi:hypothetical protein
MGAPGTLWLAPPVRLCGGCTVGSWSSRDLEMLTRARTIAGVLRRELAITDEYCATLGL